MLDSPLIFNLIGKRQDVGFDIPVLYKNTLPSLVYVSVPDDVVNNQGYTPCSCIEIHSREVIDVKLFTVSSKWIVFDSRNLDLSVGVHTYLMKLYHGREMDFYFSYRVQDSDPERPYLYMKQNKEEIKDGQHIVK